MAAMTLALESRRRIDRQLSLLDRTRSLWPERPLRYFGHLRLETRERVLDVLVADEARSLSDLLVIDWRRSPLADVFFGSDEGDSFEVEHAGRMLAGRLLERNRLRFHSGNLIELLTTRTKLARTRDGDWRSSSAATEPRLRARPRALRGRHSSPAEVELDQTQRAAVELPSGEALLVLGEAGAGKTTVALHRLARCRRLARERFRAAVIVPTEGLRRLVEQLLRQMSVPNVETWLYEPWAARQARRAFPDLPRRESADASAGVIKLKRHPSVRKALLAMAEQPPTLPDEDEPLIPSSAHVRRHDLQQLFGDRAVLERIVADSNGAISSSVIAELCEHTRIQFGLVAEEEFAHVDAERLEALDERSLDEGTPTESASTVDAEDYAVLFELDRLRAEHLRVPPTLSATYDCIVLDEAQEFSPLELRLMGRCLKPGGTLVVAGDADQQVDPGSCFLGWKASMAELGAERHHVSTLANSYRCPPEVTALARHVLDPNSKPIAQEKRSALVLTSFEHAGEQLTWLIDALRDLQSRDRYASVAVIVRTPEEARRWCTLIRRGVVARLDLDGAYALHAGITVTCVGEVKGLEFDVAIVPDASLETYPDISEARRALYVACTRPTHQLVLSTNNAWSPLLVGLQRPGADVGVGEGAGAEPGGRTRIIK
jgi:hypothetical protein